MTFHDNNMLVDVGDVRQIVLGIVYLGTDPDGADFPSPWEFASDEDSHL